MHLPSKKSNFLAQEHFSFFQPFWDFLVYFFFPHAHLFFFLTPSPTPFPFPFFYIFLLFDALFLPGRSGRRKKKPFIFPLPSCQLQLGNLADLLGAKNCCSISVFITNWNNFLLPFPRFFSEAMDARRQMPKKNKQGALTSFLTSRVASFLARLHTN